ncbi:MAG: NUDIX hydrolase [Thermoplasmata archaeon]
MKRHFVSTAYPVYENKVLLIYHNKLKMWLPPGGHIEENELPHEAAIREVKEETGIDIIIPNNIPDSYRGEPTVTLLPMISHMQLEAITDNDKGLHQHIDIVYFAIALSDKIKLNPKEAKMAKWMSENEIHASDIPLNVKFFSLKAISYINEIKYQK